VAVYGIGLEDDTVSSTLQETTRYLEHFEQYFGINYTLPKLDIVTTTKFAFGGMENWGAILIPNSSLTEGCDWLRSEEVIAHEVIHQWLGNLASNFWWTAMWVQEAPTYYLAFLASS
ncbi:unnamed protein product, partial [Ixodes hexagonus]